MESIDYPLYDEQTGSKNKHVNNGVIATVSCLRHSVSFRIGSLVIYLVHSRPLKHIAGRLIRGVLSLDLHTSFNARAERIYSSFVWVDINSTLPSIKPVVFMYEYRCRQRYDYSLMDASNHTTRLPVPVSIIQAFKFATVYPHFARAYCWGDKTALFAPNEVTKANKFAH